MTEAGGLRTCHSEQQRWRAHDSYVRYMPVPWHHHK